MTKKKILKILDNSQRIDSFICSKIEELNLDTQVFSSVPSMGSYSTSAVNSRFICFSYFTD